MGFLESFSANFSSPIILCFLLGLFARGVGSDISIPKQFYESISIYLLLAIGLKGGVQLSNFTFSTLSVPILVTLLVCVVSTVTAYIAARYVGKLSTANSTALSAHFGSVSAVTFMTAISFLDESKVSYPGYMTAVFAIMEIPAILISVSIYSAYKGAEFKTVLHEVFSGKTNILLVGGLLIGLLSGKEQIALVMPLFEGMFYGVLAFFLLEMGLIVGEKMKDVLQLKTFLLLYSICLPILNGFLGALIASSFGMGLGETTIFAVLTSSASYIAAPAAVKISMPDANPAYFITSSLVLTFPFNITFGIPLYFWFAKCLVA